jgi:TPR repeat protein
MSVPISDYAAANTELADMSMEVYYECCGKSVCRECMDSFANSDNEDRCPFCKSERMGKTDDEKVEELMKRVEANDAGAMTALGTYYFHGQLGLLQDRNKAMELWKQAAELLGYHV